MIGLSTSGVTYSGCGINKGSLTLTDGRPEGNLVVTQHSCTYTDAKVGNKYID